MNGVKNAGLPLAAAISGFSSPEMVCAIVDDHYTNWDLIIYHNYVKFLGYEQSCINHLQNYPKSTIIKNIQEKLV